MSTSAIEREQIIFACAKDPLFFGQFVAPQYFYKGFAKFHGCMLEEINNRPRGNKLVVLEVPRGFGKSAIVSVLNPLHLCIFKKRKFGIVASYAIDRANKLILDFKVIINNPNFQSLLPGTEIVKDREDLIEVRNEELGFHFQIMARGRNSQVAGMRFEEARPQFFIGDDLENPDEAYSQDIVDRNMAFIDGVVQYGLDPQIGYSVLIGTPFAFDCTTQRISKRGGTQTVRFPALVDDSISPGMSQKLGLAEGRSIWEEMFSTEFLQNERDDAIRDGTIEHFMRQRMLDPRSESADRIPLEKMHRIPPERLEDIKRMRLNVYILVDFAYSKHIWADESAYVVVGIDDESNYYLLASDSGKWGDNGTIDKIIDKILEYKANLRAVGVEVKGFGFVERRITELKRNYNLTFALEELNPKSRSKAERIKSTISLFNDGRVYIIDNQKKFEGQASRFRGEEMKHGDDIIDAWGYVTKAGFVNKPVTQKSKDEKEKEENHRLFERWAKSQPDYLKKQSVRRVRYAGAMRPDSF